MKHKITALLQNEYSKISQGEKMGRKASLSQVAGKLLIIFFVIMLLFTFLSRAAESMTVAQITIANPRTDRLYYKLTGMGKIQLSEEDYLNVLPDYRIDKVYVSTGDYVGKDTVLFGYKEEDLLNKYNSIEIDIEKMKLQIQKEQLNKVTSSGESTQVPLLSLKQAKDNLNTAKANLSVAEEELKESSIKTREELLEGKRKEYAEAEKNFDSVINQQEKQSILSLRTLEDAKSALTKANEKPEHWIKVIEDYKTAVLSEDNVSIYNAKESIFQAYYGSTKAYEEHKDAVLTSALAVSSDDETLMLLQYLISYYSELISTASDELQKAQNSTDPTINYEGNIRTMKEKYNNAWLNYINEQALYQSRLSYLENAITTSGNDLKKLRRDDKKLEEYLNTYQLSINEPAEDNAKKALYEFLQGDDAGSLENDITAKELARSRAEEDYELLEKGNESEKADLQAELKELEDTIKSMEDGTYDYEGALEGKKQEVKSAKEAVRLAKQAVETYQLQYETAGQNDADRMAMNQKNNQISELTLEGYQIDLQEKETELEAVRQLLESFGKVTSPYEGTVTFINLEEGKTASADEMVKIGFGDYLFRAEFDGSNAGYVKPGSEVEVSRSGIKTGIKTEINNITIDESGLSELTAILPGNGYVMGEAAEFNVTAQSDRFDLCIPIQALREDSYGYYVLVTREQENVLGTELIADRINVEVIDKDTSTVVVDGAISQKDKVITDSSKYIESGDKVRIK